MYETLEGTKLDLDTLSEEHRRVLVDVQAFQRAICTL